MHIYNFLQPLFLKNITAYPGDQTQLINAAVHASVSRKSSLFTGSNLDNEDVSSGSETKGKKNYICCKCVDYLYESLISSRKF